MDRHVSGRRLVAALVSSTLVAAVGCAAAPLASAQVEIRYFGRPKLTTPVTKRGGVETKAYVLEFTWVDQRGEKHREELDVGVETTTTNAGSSSSRYAGRETKSVTWETAPYFRAAFEGDEKPFRLRDACLEVIERDPRFLWTVGPIVVRNEAERDVTIVPVRWRDADDETRTDGIESFTAEAARSRRVVEGGKPVLASRFVCTLETPGGRTGPFDFAFDPRREAALQVTIEDELLAPIVCLRADAAPERPFTYEWTVPDRCAAIVRVRRESEDGRLRASIRGEDGRGVSALRLSPTDSSMVLGAAAGETLVVRIDAEETAGAAFRVELLRVPYLDLMLDHVGRAILEKGLEFIGRSVLEDDFDSERTSRRMVEDLALESVLLVFVPALIELASSDPPLDWRRLDVVEAADRVDAFGEAGVPGELALGVLSDVIGRIRAQLERSAWFSPEVDLSAGDGAGD